MTVYYSDEQVTLHRGDCVEVLATLPGNSIDAICTDPPYELGFMGKHWDGSGIAFNPATWALCLRVLKPGGHMLAFGGTRTSHRLASAIEDAGFEIRDSIAWLYGSGFPKSLDVSKAIDNAAGAERTEVIGIKPGHENFVGRDGYKSVEGDGALSGEGGFERPWMHDEAASERYHQMLAPATDAAKQWQGWGTALKPAFEPIVVARKPIQGTVAANVLAHGTGALNIDACRIEAHDDQLAEKYASAQNVTGPRVNTVYGTDSRGRAGSEPHAAGRWPANVVLDGDMADELDKQSGISRSGTAVQRNGGGQRIFNHGVGLTRDDAGYGDSGGASRFFPTFRYTAKAATAERPTADGISHPTVKPLELMRWLVRLVTPPGGVVLDPFAGSGTVGEAAIHEHKHAVLIEREPAYLPLIVARLSKPMAVGFDFGEPA